jgi:hypothetical protein
MTMKKSGLAASLALNFVLGVGFGYMVGHGKVLDPAVPDNARSAVSTAPRIGGVNRAAIGGFEQTGSDLARTKPYESNKISSAALRPSPAIFFSP